MTTRPRILLVDDEPENLRVLVRALRTQYDVDTAERPDDALAKIEGGEFAVIITDQRMPGMDGVTMLTRARERKPEVMRVILTAHTDTQDLIRCVNDGEVHRYLTKPVQIEELRSVVAQVVEHHRLVRERALLLDELTHKNEQLSRQAQELSRLNADLEKVVSVRTEALARANRDLQHALAQVSELARTDALTGVLNRRSFDEFLARELERATRFTHSFSVLMIDFDHFKRINDEHGHQAGDEALRRFAKLAAANTRHLDVLARFGGEEFVMLLVETPEAGGLNAAEKVRHAQEANGLHTTVSIGLASFPKHGRTAGELLAAADRALYTAKSSGRNCIRVANP